MANDPALAALAQMLMRKQHAQVHPMGSQQMPPERPPMMGAMQQMPPERPPQAIQPSGPPPAPPMTATPAMPPPSVAPGDQTTPSPPMQSATAADAGNPIAQAPGFWDRWKMMLPQGQVPQQYRGVMGEQIGNG